MAGMLKGQLAPATPQPGAVVTNDRGETVTVKLPGK